MRGALALASVLTAALLLGWHPPASAQTERADSAFDAEDRALAERLYVQVLAEDPWNSRATYRLAVLRRDRPLEALRLYRRYAELEPDDAWGWIALASQLDGVGRTDEALGAAGRARDLAGDELDVLLLSGRLLQRAGRFREALEAYRRAEAVGGGDDPLPARRVRWLEGELAPQGWPTFSASRDSDGNVVARGDVKGDAAVGRAARVGVAAGTARVAADARSASVLSTAVTLAWRPRADLRVTAEAGGARLLGAAGESGSWTPQGDARVRWRSPGRHGGVEFRVQRGLLAASPDLVTVAVVRTEAGAQVDVPMGSTFALRAAGRLADYTSDLDDNRRVLLRGGPVWHGLPAGELSLQFHDQRFQRPTASPYFAPREVRMVEAALYSEWEGAGPWLLVLDVGAGAQELARHGEEPGGWTPALRADLSATYNVAGGKAVRLGLEAYDSRIADVVTGTGASWRYLAVSLGARWRIR